MRCRTQPSMTLSPELREYVRSIKSPGYWRRWGSSLSHLWQATLAPKTALLPTSGSTQRAVSAWAMVSLHSSNGDPAERYSRSVMAVCALRLARRLRSLWPMVDERQHYRQQPLRSVVDEKAATE
jgi:hypothetical protein